MNLRNGRLKRQSNHNRMPEEKAVVVRAAPEPAKRVRNVDDEGRVTYRAFTCRFPVALYDRLLRDAVADERSVTAQMQVYLEEFYMNKLLDKS